MKDKSENENERLKAYLKERGYKFKEPFLERLKNGLKTMWFIRLFNAIKNRWKRGKK